MNTNNMNHTDLNTTMRLNLQRFNLRPLETIDAWVKKQLVALGQARQIDEANIRLVRYENESPSYQVNVHLITPGPDLFSESRDHTLRAALLKAIEQVRNQITSRARKRLKRFKSNLAARRRG